MSQTIPMTKKTRHRRRKVGSFGMSDDALKRKFASDEELRSRFVPKMTKYSPHTPTPKQQAFLLLNNLEAFYGGAAGGGKSDALLMAALQYVDLPGYNAILFRDTFQNLTKPGSLLDRAHEWLAPTDAKWSGEKKRYTFPSGATLSFGFLDSPRDHFNYQSAEFQFVGLDECVNIRENQALYMFSRLRKLKGVDIPLRFRCASNPPTAEQVERGHWVKVRYVESETREPGAVFISARLVDNPFLNADEYTKSLYKLDPITRKQLLEGDWDVQLAGTMFDPAWFERVDYTAVPKTGKVTRGWDMAASEEIGTAFTAGVRMRRTPNGIFYIENVVRFRGRPEVVESRIKGLAAADGIGVRISLPQDPGAAGKSVKSYYYKALQGYNVRCTPESGSKIERAAPVSSQAEAGNVKVVKAQWNDMYFDELLLFPNSIYMDMMDATSRAFHDLLTGDNRTKVGPPQQSEDYWAHSPEAEILREERRRYAGFSFHNKRTTGKKKKGHSLTPYVGGK